MIRQAMRVLALVALFAAISSAAAEQSGLTVDGTEFILTVGDGRTLRSADLVGSLTIKVRSGTQIVSLTIQSVEEDPEASGGKVVLHHFLVQDENGGAAELCTPDATGRSRGFPIP